MGNWGFGDVTITKYKKNLNIATLWTQFQIINLSY